jgi:hypothetical protein
MPPVGHGCPSTMKPKPDFKKLYEAAQEGCNRLRIERDAFQRQAEEAGVRAEAHYASLATLLILYVILFIGAVAKIRESQTPIREPYPVQVDRSDDHFASAMASLLRTKDKLTVCQDAWRTDEKMIRKLEREKP